MDRDDELWAAIGDPSRRRVLDALLARGEATPTMLARELPLTRQAITKHLVVLDRAGLLEGRRLGREVRYVVSAERLAAAAGVMARAAARWDARLAAIKRIAESVHQQRNAQAEGTHRRAANPDPPPASASSVRPKGRRHRVPPAGGRHRRIRRARIRGHAGTLVIVSMERVKE